MKLTADTNLLVRMIVRDDPRQAEIAQKILSDAALVALPLSCLCELSWVLVSVYGYSRAEVAEAIATIVDVDNVVMDLEPVETGLSMLAASGDFADGVIASAGNALGGETFVSFDRKAVARLASLGLPATNARDLE